MAQHALREGEYWELRARGGDVQRAEQMVRQAMVVLEQATAAQRACLIRLGGVYGFDAATVGDVDLNDHTLTLCYASTPDAG